MADEIDEFAVPGDARSRAFTDDDPATIADLPGEVLELVFLAVGDQTWVRHTVPMVCRDWNEVFCAAGSSPLHDTLEIDFDKEVETAAAVAAAAAASERGGGGCGGGGGPGPDPGPGPAPVVAVAVAAEGGEEEAQRRPVVHASSVIAWAERHGGSVQKLRLKGGPDASLERFSAKDLAALVAVLGPSLTHISIGRRFGLLCKGPSFWRALRDHVVPAGRLRSLVVRGIVSAVGEADVEPLAAQQQGLAGSLEELVLETRSARSSEQGGPVGLRRIPEALFALAGLRSLELAGHYQIEAVPARISALRKLESLDLGACNLQSVPRELGELSRLTSLDLSENYKLGNLPEGQAFPAELANMRSLRELRLNHCRLRAVPAFVGELESLELLDISRCRLSSLPRELGKLSRLKKLDIRVNEGLGGTPQHEAFPAELGRMKSMRELYLDRCGLSAVPAFVGELDSLRVLDLSHCKLSSLPRELGNLSRLTKLDLRGVRDLGTTLPVEEAFPAELGQMKSLRELCLSSCRLGGVPAFVGELKSLEVLDLTGCDFRTVPAFVGELRSLKVLNLSHCRLSSLPRELGGLSQLETLNLSFSPELGSAPEGEAFPAELGNMKSLRDLSLSSSGLLGVPAFVGELESLEVLTLCHCRLISLPRELGKLSRLRRLDLKGNQHLGNALPAAEAFPAGLEKMAALRELDLTHCGIRTVPAFVGELRALQSIDFTGCGLRAVPALLGELRALEALNVSYNTDLRVGGGAPPLDFLLEGCPRLREVTLTQFAAWSSQSLAHLKAFEAKLLARNRKAKVAY